MKSFAAFHAYYKTLNYKVQSYSPTIQSCAHLFLSNLLIITKDVCVQSHDGNLPSECLAGDLSIVQHQRAMAKWQLRHTSHLTHRALKEGECMYCVHVCVCVCVWRGGGGNVDQDLLLSHARTRTCIFAPTSNCTSSYDYTVVGERL